MTHGRLDRLVDVVGGQQLVSRAEPEGPQHGVYTARGVGHEPEVPGPGPDEPPHCLLGHGQEILPAAVEKLDGPGFDPLPPGRLGLQNRRRRGSEAPVVQEGDGPVEHPVRDQVLPDRFWRGKRGRSGVADHGARVAAGTPAPAI